MATVGLQETDQTIRSPGLCGAIPSRHLKGRLSMLDNITRGSRCADTKCSVIAISAVGADPENTWKVTVQNQDGSYTVDRESWITRALRDKIPCARVLIYSHGKPKEDDDLDSLATNLLEHVISERKGDVRHMFFSR